jgi:hypothetical protein
LSFSPRLKHKDPLTKKSLSIKLPVPNADNLLFQRNTSPMPRNSIANLRKVPALIKDTPFQMVPKTSLFHSSEPSTLLNSKNLLLVPLQLLFSKLKMDSAQKLTFQINGKPASSRNTNQNSPKVPVLQPVTPKLTDQKKSHSHSLVRLKCLFTPRLRTTSK